MIRKRLARLSLIFPALLMAAGCVLSVPNKSTPSTETVQVAEAAYSIGDYDEAARLFELAAARDAKSVPALVGLGKSYTALGQFNRAQNALLRARQINRRNPEIHNQLGALALEEMQPKQAIEHFDRALRSDRDNLAALTGKAVALDYLSRHHDAQEVYRRALQHHPTNFPLLSNYALSQVLSGQIGAGIKLMEELLKDPRNGETIRANMAIAYALDGRGREARALLTGVLSEAEIAAALRLYASARKAQALGKPIGYMIFQ